MFKKILVPLDGSLLAEDALSVAISLSDQHDGRIILVRVPLAEQVLAPAVTIFDAYHLEMSLQRQTEISRQYLAQLKDRLALHGIPVYSRIYTGEPSAVIVSTAAAERADLIVMSTHGRSGFKRILFGSVTERVLQTATCPVLAIRKHSPIRHILLTLDGSELADSVIDPAMSLAETLEAKVTLFFVEPYDLDDYWEQTRPQNMADDKMRQHIQQEMSTHLAQVAANYGSRGIQIKTVIYEGDPAASIADYAQKADVDVIAMSTHGRTGLKRMIFGSVTEAVLHATTAALFVVRPHLM